MELQTPRNREESGSESLGSEQPLTAPISLFSQKVAFSQPIFCSKLKQELPAALFLWSGGTPAQLGLCVSSLILPRVVRKSRGIGVEDCLREISWAPKFFQWGQTTDGREC